MKIAIIADSVSCPTKEQLEKYEFEIVPINVRIEGKVYRDYIDITPTQIYRMLDKIQEGWATSAPSPGDWLASYKRAMEKGAKEIICITIFKNQSATWNSARIAAEMIKSDHPDLKIEIIDSRTAGAGENILCQIAAKEREKGKTFEEIVSLIKDLTGQVRVYLLPETIKYVYRSGRVPEIVSKIGSRLPLKIIMGVHLDKVSFEGTALSKEKGVEKILKTLRETYDKNYPDIILMHADAQKEIEELSKKVSDLLPQSQITISDFSAVTGYMTGPGTLLLGFIAKK